MKEKKYSSMKDSPLQEIRKKKELSIRVRLTPEENTLLETMMEKEEWENTSGFIRHKLFGLDPEKTLKRKMAKGDRKEIEIFLKNLLENFNRNLVYSTLRFERQVDAFQKETTQDKSRKYQKWASLLREYYLRFHSESETMIEMYFDMLKPLCNITVEKVSLLEGKERDTFLKCIPQDILDIYVKENPQDSISPMMMEHARRVEESKKKSK